MQRDLHLRREKRVTFVAFVWSASVCQFNKCRHFFFPKCGLSWKLLGKKEQRSTSHKNWPLWILFYITNSMSLDWCLCKCILTSRRPMWKYVNRFHLLCIWKLPWHVSTFIIGKKSRFDLKNLFIYLIHCVFPFSVGQRTSIRGSCHRSFHFFYPSFIIIESDREWECERTDHKKTSRKKIRESVSSTQKRKVLEKHWRVCIQWPSVQDASDPLCLHSAPISWGDLLCPAVMPFCDV